MIIVHYLLRLLPGLVPAAALFLLLQKAHHVFHLLLFIIVFIFTRDAMMQSKTAGGLR